MCMCEDDVCVCVCVCVCVSLRLVDAKKGWQRFYLYIFFASVVLLSFSLSPVAPSLPLKGPVYEI